MLEHDWFKTDLTGKVLSINKDHLTNLMSMVEQKSLRGDEDDAE